MRISESQFFAGIWTVAAIAGLLAGCSEDSCIRFSDCDNGYTCAEGRCVKPAAASISATGEDDASVASTPAKGDAAAVPTKDAGSDVAQDAPADGGSDAADAMTPVIDAATDV